MRGRINISVDAYRPKHGSGVAKACGDGDFIELWDGALAGWYFPMRE
ncbi:MAG: hypothetical protein IPH50_04585 [Rhodanobacteraceae bacterium]|nr:hypothetical protein [Rhodanobacteraceae bacterium]